MLAFFSLSESHQLCKFAGMPKVWDEQVIPQTARRSTRVKGYDLGFLAFGTKPSEQAVRTDV
jgi:hypothetical protein